MGILNIFAKTDNKYDTAIRSFYLIFYAAGLIVFVAVGLDSMELQTWILAFFFSALGATVYGTIARTIITMIRKDRPVDKPDILIRLFFIIFFALATVAFFAIGFEENNIKTWIIAFVGSYGAAAIFSTIVKIVITLGRSEK